MAVAKAAAAPGDTAARGWSSAPVVIWFAGGQGRPAAIVLALLLALGYLALGERGWSPIRNLFFDAYQRLMPRQVSFYPAVIVDIDDASLAALGRWPWPRTRLARLIEATHRSGALAVGLDVVMPEPDSLSPVALFGERQDVSPALQKSLAELPSNDMILAETLRRIPTVVGRVGIADGKVQNTPPSGQTPVIMVGENPAPHLQSYAQDLTNVPEIEAAASGRGYLNDTRDRDGVVRSLPLLIAVNGEPAPSFALELLRVAAGQSGYTVRSGRNGIDGVQIGTSFIPTDPNGRIPLHFSPAYAGRRVPARAVLGGEVAPDAFANQVAIIGATAIGITDAAATPVATSMNGVEIQAQFIENILAGARLKRPPAILWLEGLAFLSIAMLLILLLPRTGPSWGVVIFLTGAIIVWAVSLIFYLQAKTLFDPSFATVGNILILLLLLTAGWLAAERRRRELDAALEVERVERLRMAGELQAAREIQMGMLPVAGAIKGLPPQLEFYAMLEPALEVGGDLYDAFMLDDDRFFFLVGDVSGKGVPASLFMALSKTLCKSLARREHGSLDALLRLVNEEISQENPGSLFITAILGVINVRTGEMQFCSAGHDAPILLRASEPPRSLNGTGGLPLCVDEDFPYTADQIQLQPGDTLIVLTDGITEAQDANKNFYGLARVLAYLPTLEGAQRSAAALCAGLYGEVKRFTQGSPPSDDITIMAIRLTSIPPTPDSGSTSV
jgi:adenylate cyclase